MHLCTWAYRYVELSFMPSALASGNTSKLHYHANITPPRRLEAWADLVRELARFLIDRYGIERVSSWRFEVR